MYLADYKRMFLFSGSEFLHKKWCDVYKTITKGSKRIIKIITTVYIWIILYLKCLRKIINTYYISNYRTQNNLKGMNS